MRAFTDLISEIEYPWVLNILARNAPEAALFDRVLARAGHALKNGGKEGQQAEALISSLLEQYSAEVTLVTTARWVALASWLQSGSPLISVDEASAGILDTLESPRFHALTLPAGSDDNARTYAINWAGSDFVYTFFVWASVAGPVVHAVLVSKNFGQDGEIGMSVDLSGSWDALRWQANKKDLSPEMRGAFTRIINAVAAIEESREVLRRSESKKAGKRRKKRLIRRKGRAVTYRLDQNALDAWVERVARPRQAGFAEPVGRQESSPRRIHECREHTRRMWVRSPAEGEAVLGVREGRKGQLFCVKRVVKKHGRGSVVGPKTLKLTAKKEK